MKTPSSDIETLADDPQLACLIRVSAAIIGNPVVSARRVTKGGNNVTVMLETDDARFVAKHYPLSAGDNRDRFMAETHALRFMNDQGFDCVPSLIGCDPEARVAIMEYAGSGMTGLPSAHDIDVCARFVSRLHQARHQSAAKALPKSAEACLMPEDVWTQIAERRKRFDDVIDGHPELAAFLKTDFDPAYHALVTAAKAGLAAADIQASAPLARAMQTLSPSDFGFHNTVRRTDGTLVFVDFEYFGHDDPARLVSDFVLHPGHQLSDFDKRRFVEVCGGIFSAEDPDFTPRYNALYPLVGLRWCMILINEFLPERLARRRAAGNTADARQILERQLNKSRQLFGALDNSKRHVIN